ncbi:MAG: DNA polymerase III subunit delta [Verrucomicrobiota bacterium]
MATQQTPAKPVPAKPREPSLHLIYGEDEYPVSTHARELVDRLCPPAEQAFGLEIVEARANSATEAIAAIRRCLDALQTIGFLGGRKVVWLRDANFFSGASEDVRNVVQDLVEMIKGGFPPGQVLVVSASKVDGRFAFLKACQAAGEVREFSLPEKSKQVEQQAAAWAETAFRDAGLRASDAALEEFLERTGPDSRQIAQEVEKLRTYLGDRKEVGPEDVEAIVSRSRETEVWDFADAVGERDLPDALRVLRLLLFQGENALGLLISLENRFRELILYRQYLDRGWLHVTGDARWRKAEWKSAPEADAFLSSLPRDPRQLHPYRLLKLMEQAGKYSVQELLRCQALVVEAHETFVSGSPQTKDLLPEFLVIRLLGTGKAARTAIPRP